MPAGLGTLFVGLLLIVLAFVEGDSVWKSAHQILFGLFGCGSFVLGAAVCYLAILYTRGQDLLMQVFKLLLGLIFASGTVIVFSDIPADLTAAQMIAACYQNGANAWLGGGVLGKAPGIAIFPEEFGIKVLTLPVGGFLTLGCLIALMQWALAKSAKKKEAK